MNNKILITGSNGFIGHHLVKTLISKGFELHCLLRETSTPLANGGKITNHYYDGSYEDINRIVKISRPFIVIHLATYFINEHEPTDIENLIQSNIMFGVQLLESMKENKIKLLLNFGTMWQHFNNNSYEPKNLYSATKQSFIDIIYYYTLVNNINCLTLKLSDTYGPDDKRKKIFNIIKDAAKKGKKLNMTKGEQKLNLLYIDDIIDGIMIAINRLVKSKKGYEEFSLAASKPTSLKDIVDLFIKLSNLKIEINWGGKEYSIREQMTPPSLVPILPNWRPLINFDEGIKKII